MATFVYYNSYSSTLSGAITNSATTISVTAAGSLVTPAATEELRLTIVDPFDPDTYEIVKCTAVSGLDLTVTRGVEGTSGQVWASGAVVSARLTAEMLDGMAAGFDNGGDARGFEAVNLQPARGASTEVASGSGAIVIGRDTIASGLYSIAIGDHAESTGASRTVALGGYSAATSDRQTAINLWTNPSGRTATYACHLNSYKYAAAEYQRHIGGFEYVAPHEWWYSGSADADFTAKNTCQEMVVYSDPVNLGNAPTWAATTVYSHGDVIFPTTPNGKCYVCGEWGATYFTSGTSGASEPTWGTTAGGNTSGDGDLSWRCADPAEYQMAMPDYLRFIPTEVGFVCDTVSDTTQPFISFGVNGSLAKWLASTQTTKLTGDYAGQAFTPTNTEGAKQFGAALVTAGTGNYTGRFYWKGIVIEILSA